MANRLRFWQPLWLKRRRGVEMEALVACTTAPLTIYDMLKAIDRAMTIGQVRLLEKSGDRSDYPVVLPIDH